MLSKTSLENVRLKSENNKLTQDRETRKKKFSKKRQQMRASKISRIKQTIAKAPSKMIPYIGIGLIAASTTYDVKEYCNDIDEMQELEIDIFGNSDDDVKQLCGVEYEVELNKLEDQANKAASNLIIYKKELGLQYNSSSEYMKQLFNEALEAMSDQSQEEKQSTLNAYKNYINTSNASPKTKDILDETFKYWNDKWK